MASKSPLPEEQGPTFDPTIHWCARHLEPFRETWSQSAAWVQATLGIFEVCLRRQDIIDACGADARMLDRVLREYAPLCCLVGDETTEYWTRLALGPAEDWKAAHKTIREESVGDR